MRTDYPPQNTIFMGVVDQVGKNFITYIFYYNALIHCTTVGIGIEGGGLKMGPELTPISY